MNKNKLKNIEIVIFAILISIVIHIGFKENIKNENIVQNNKISYEINNIPEYSGNIYVEVNNNIPNFSLEDINIEEDYYSNLKNGKVRNGND